jgi:predicted phosphodiesterase
MSEFNEQALWTDREKKIIYKLKKTKEGITSQQISDILVQLGYPRRTAGAIRGIWRRGKEIIDELSEDVKDLFGDIQEEPNIFPEENSIEPAWAQDEISDDYEEAFSRMESLKQDAIKSTAYLYKHVGRPKEEATIKVVSISDMHIPFQHDAVMEDMIAKHSDADILVINGDFLELYSVSSWPKNKSVMLRKEYEQGLKVLKRLSEIFPKIYMTKGNHEDRLQRYFTSNVDPSISFMTDPDILQRLSKGYDFNEEGDLVKKHNFNNVFYRKGHLSWYVQIGRCVFVHPSGGSGVPMRTAIKATDYLLSRTLEFDAVCCAHTHQIGQIIYNNKLLIEQGCACVPLEYESTSKMAYRPQSFGYAVIMMNKKGHVDFDKSGAVFCGTGSVIRPDSCLIELGDK